jgi:hypothetical protein
MLILSTRKSNQYLQSKDVAQGETGGDVDSLSMPFQHHLSKLKFAILVVDEHDIVASAEIEVDGHGGSNLLHLDQFAN